MYAFIYVGGVLFLSFSLLLTYLFIFMHFYSFILFLFLSSFSFVLYVICLFVFVLSRVHVDSCSAYPDLFGIKGVDLSRRKGFFFWGGGGRGGTR